MHFISDFTQVAVREVFETMLSLKVEPVRACSGLDMPSSHVTGVVSSVGMAGKITGTVYLHYSAPLACAITERMIGVRPARVQEPDVSDVVGEITNMVAGTIKRHTSQRGYDGWLSTPMVLLGDDIVVEGKGAPIAIFNLFRLPELNEELGVRVFVKIET